MKSNRGAKRKRHTPRCIDLSTNERINASHDRKQAVGDSYEQSVSACVILSSAKTQSITQKMGDEDVNCNDVRRKYGK